MQLTSAIIVRLLLTSLVLLQTIGCQSMRTVEESPESTRQGIADGSLLEEGMWVTVYLVSGESIYLQVDRVSEGQIIGHHHAVSEGEQFAATSSHWTEISVSISEVERLERGEFSAAKTTAAASVVIIPVVLLILLIIAAAAVGPPP